jgi:hypothetical protein
VVQAVKSLAASPVLSTEWATGGFYSAEDVSSVVDRHSAGICREVWRFRNVMKTLQGQCVRIGAFCCADHAPQADDMLILRKLKLAAWFFLAEFLGTLCDGCLHRKHHSGKTETRGRNTQNEHQHQVLKFAWSSGVDSHQPGRR